MRVRMYRVGFGDCFLVSFGEDHKLGHILIDFGTHPAGSGISLEPVMANIEAESHEKLDAVVATHAHQDHLSGFGKFADQFGRFTIGQILMPWTDNPADADALKFDRKYVSLAAALQNEMGSYSRQLSSSEAAALRALANLQNNEIARDALRRAFRTHAEVRYLSVGDMVAIKAIPGLSIEVLAPSKRPEFLFKMNPPSSQRYLNRTMLGPGFSEQRFFRRHQKAPEDYFQQLTKSGYSNLADFLLSESERTNFRRISDAPPDRVALTLDSIRNNTSLVLLFRYGGISALFTGDAQWGSWTEWARAERGSRILSDLDFMKVSHHGSTNATPRFVVDSLRRNAVSIMLSTASGIYSRVPKDELLLELGGRAKNGLVLRSDEGAVSGESTPHEPWIDCFL